MSLVSIFVTAIVPILALATAGGVLGRMTDVDAQELNVVVLYVLIPALVFHSLSTSTLAGGTFLKVVVGFLAFGVGMAVLAELVGRALGRTEPLLSALVLLSAFPNSGNYGIPLATFAFGETGRSTAVLFLTTQSVFTYTVGVYIASRSSGASGLRGVRNVVRLPLIYAAAAALLARWAGVVPPVGSDLMEFVGLVGDSSIPLMLIILGIQLARTDYGTTLSAVGLPAVLKLGVAPLVGAAVALLVGFGDPAVTRAFVLETAMPSAVTPLILLTEFSEGVEANGVPVTEFVSTTILATTLLSVPLLTVLVTLLNAGIL